LLSWIVAFFGYFCLGCDYIEQSEELMTASEGDAAVLKCEYNTEDQSPCLLWYKQQRNGFPKFVLMNLTFRQGHTELEIKAKFSENLDSKSSSVPLRIQKLHVIDSAVYYCALIVSGTNYALQWYVQYSRSRPEFIDYIFLSQIDKDSVLPGMPVNLDKNQSRVDLLISFATISNSAMYYCALAPTVTGNPAMLYKKPPTMKSCISREVTSHLKNKSHRL
uniref:Ig-like domain-containing protein n=1 Tax=Electrophorus electricus TaxID=8005 RepID=A0AAY5ETD0_ELEEL